MYSREMDQRAEKAGAAGRDGIRRGERKANGCRSEVYKVL